MVSVIPTPLLLCRYEGGGKRLKGGGVAALTPHSPLLSQCRPGGGAGLGCLRDWSVIFWGKKADATFPISPSPPNPPRYVQPHSVHPSRVGESPLETFAISEFSPETGGRGGFATLPAVNFC